MKRMRQLGWVLILLCLGLAIAAYMGFRYLNQPIHFSAQQVSYELRAGSSFNRIAKQLSTQGVITQPRLWTLYARFTSQATMVKAGEYLIESGITPLQLLDKLVAGEVMRYQITLVEGWTFKQLLEALAKEEKLHHRLSDQTAAGVMEMLGKTGEHPEGRFFPDSYQFTRDTSDLDILKRAYDRLADILATEWQQKAENLPYQSPYEALIMASIVEKETGQESERGEIAGVFVRRLQMGMRLQTDPTVIYGLGDSYSGNLRRKHLRQHTPYNTYVINGLPPTPISLVGREAIHAALHPEAGDSLYFVARGDGSHFFSATLEQHNQAVKRFQIDSRAEQYRSSPK